MKTDDKVERLAKRLKRANRAFAMATVVRTENATSAKPGAKAVVHGDGAIEGWIGGGCTQPAVRKAARDAIGDGRSRLIRVQPDAAQESGPGIEDYQAHCHSGGTLDIFVEPMLPRPTLLVLGASPAGQALASLARDVGFAVTAACRKEDTGLFRRIDRVIEGFELGENAAAIGGFVVVASQGRGDLPALKAALATGAEYIAFVASRRKAEKIKAELAAEIGESNRIAAIRAPAGLDIGAVTPEEIALSILAEMVRERRLAFGNYVAAPAEAEAGTVSVELVPADPPGCAGDGSDVN